MFSFVKDIGNAGSCSLISTGNATGSGSYREAGNCLLIFTGNATGSGSPATLPEAAQHRLLFADLRR